MPLACLFWFFVPSAGVLSKRKQFAFPPSKKSAFYWCACLQLTLSLLDDTKNTLHWCEWENKRLLLAPKCQSNHNFNLRARYCPTSSTLRKAVSAPKNQGLRFSQYKKFLAKASSWSRTSSLCGKCFDLCVLLNDAPKKVHAGKHIKDKTRLLLQMIIAFVMG